MEPYSLLLWLGFGGLIFMAVAGAAGGNGHHAVSHGCVRIANRHPGASAVSRAHTAQHPHSQHTSAGSRVLNWLSPRVLFAVALGAGASGLLTAPYYHSEIMRAGVAIAGGIGLEKLVIAPIWDFLMHFASNPARNLESAVFEEARALTNFDSDGCGLVSIILDGREMRVLARLNVLKPRPKVRAGDLLFVEEVDAARGQCRVSKV